MKKQRPNGRNHYSFEDVRGNNRWWEGEDLHFVENTGVKLREEETNEALLMLRL